MYVYCFTSTPLSAVDLPVGIAGPLVLLTDQNLTAIAEPDIPLEKIQADEEQLLRAVVSHDRVVRHLFQQCTVLPVRFGTQFYTESDLIVHLRQNYVSYCQQIERLQGWAEYTITLVPTPADPVSSTGANQTVLTGRDYLLAKKQRYQDQQIQQQQRSTELSKLSLAIAESYDRVISADPQAEMQRFHLLAEYPANQLLKRIAHWQQQFSHWQIQLGTALPPYHFV